MKRAVKISKTNDAFKDYTQGDKIVQGPIGAAFNTKRKKVQKEFAMKWIDISTLTEAEKEINRKDAL